MLTECKYTGNAQYVLRAADIEKLRRQAGGRTPIMEVLFTEQGVRVYVVPEHVVKVFLESQKGEQA